MTSSIGSSSSPSAYPSSRPSLAPSTSPTALPLVRPSAVPSSRPSTIPSSSSSFAPSSRPSAIQSSCPSSLPSSSPTAAPYELPSCPAGWTLHCSCQWSPTSPRRFLQSAIEGVMHMHDYDRFAVGFMTCLMMLIVLYLVCTYAVGKVQRAYLVETTP